MLNVKRDGAFIFRLNGFERDLLDKLAQTRALRGAELLRSLIRKEASEAGLMPKPGVSDVTR